MRYEDTLRLVQRLQARNRFQQTMQGAEIARLHQQNELRPKFFAAAAALAWVVILGNFVIVGWYAWHAREALNPNVLMFWISSTVVEVLGIVYIIAQYLFPKVAASKTGNKEDASADVRNASKETISD